MHDCHKLTALAKALKTTKGYFVLPTAEEELVVIRKEEFDKLNESKQEVQLELETTPISEAEPDIHEDDLELVNQELAMQQENQDNYDPNVMEEQLEVGPRKKVRFEPIKGDISPELQE